jgi:hypothetical protein
MAPALRSPSLLVGSLATPLRWIPCSRRTRPLSAGGFASAALSDRRRRGSARPRSDFRICASVAEAEDGTLGEDVADDYYSLLGVVSELFPFPFVSGRPPAHDPAVPSKYSHRRRPSELGTPSLSSRHPRIGPAVGYSRSLLPTPVIPNGKTTVGVRNSTRCQTVVEAALARYQ